MATKQKPADEKKKMLTNEAFWGWKKGDEANEEKMAEMKAKLEDLKAQFAKFDPASAKKYGWVNPAGGKSRKPRKSRKRRKPRKSRKRRKSRKSRKRRKSRKARKYKSRKYKST